MLNRVFAVFQQQSLFIIMNYNLSFYNPTLRLSPSIHAHMLHTHTHVHTHTYTHTHVRTHTYTYAHTYVQGAKAIMKDIAKYLPGIGWTFMFMEYPFLKRDWKKDEKRLTASCKNLSDYPVNMLVSSLTCMHIIYNLSNKLFCAYNYYITGRKVKFPVCPIVGNL